MDNTDFSIASDHPYKCRCRLCLEWWREVGPEPDGDLDDYESTIKEQNNET